MSNRPPVSLYVSNNIFPTSIHTHAHTRLAPPHPLMSPLCSLFPAPAAPSQFPPPYNPHPLSATPPSSHPSSHPSYPSCPCPCCLPATPPLQVIIIHAQHFVILTRLNIAYPAAIGVIKGTLSTLTGAEAYLAFNYGCVVAGRSSAARAQVREGRGREGGRGGGRGGGRADGGGGGRAVSGGPHHPLGDCGGPPRPSPAHCLQPPPPPTRTSACPAPPPPHP